MGKKKTVIIIVLIALAVAVAVAGFYIYNLPVTKSKAAVKTTLTALEKCDFTTAKSHINYSKLSKDTDILSLNEDGLTDAQMKTIEKALFSNMTYSIVSVKRTSSTSAVVQAKITNLNMKKVLEGWYDDVIDIALEYAFSNDTTANEKKATAEMIDKLVVNVNKVKKAKGYSTATVDITVGKNKKGQWVIADNDKLYDAILGGFITAVKELADE